MSSSSAAQREIVLTLKLRLRDKHASELNRQARVVNFVWNYLNETQQKAAKLGRRWLTYCELSRLTSGSSVLLNVHAHTIQNVCRQYDRSRRQRRRPWLRFRGRKSLGWVPFNTNHVRFDGTMFKFRGAAYEPMHLREIPEGAIICAGSFNRDARGRWYINAPVKFPASHFPQADKSTIGVDLGLKDLASLSTGEKIAAPRFYRSLQDRLGKAHIARKRRLKRSLSAKIANMRKDHLHKASARIALAHNLIFVGNVSSEKLARTRLAKSVLDAGWSTLRNQLSYKAMRHGGRMIEVNERLTTQTCSACGSLPEGRPKGIAGLGIRQWECGDCGTVHDRDVNAAMNIARLGQQSLAEGAAA